MYRGPALIGLSFSACRPFIWENVGRATEKRCTKPQFPRNFRIYARSIRSIDGKFPKFLLPLLLLSFCVRTSVPDSFGELTTFPRPLGPLLWPNGMGVPILIQGRDLKAHRVLSVHIRSTGLCYYSQRFIEWMIHFILYKEQLNDSEPINRQT